MKHKFKLFLVGVMCTLMFSACGSDPALTQFKNEMDDFCTAISEIDTSINQVDADAENAVSLVLEHLNELDTEFQRFADLDFPEEFDYLESLADESGEYMSTAVAKYHEAYSNGSYNEYIAEYAKENYARAYKRVQVIITFLHGEEPEDVDLTTSAE